MDTNEPTNEDVANSIVKGVLGAIPIVGALATELFGLIVVPPLEKRRVEWMNEIASRLKTLEDKNLITVENLKNNEQFIDTILQATTYVLKTSEKEKIIAFQNALLNTALPEAPEKTKSQIFLNQLDSFTDWHIRILKFIDYPKEWFKNSNLSLPVFVSGSTKSVIFTAFPNLKTQGALLDPIWRDLVNANFVDDDGLQGNVSSDSALARRTTPFGREFIEFITSRSI